MSNPEPNEIIIIESPQNDISPTRQEPPTIVTAEAQQNALAPAGTVTLVANPIKFSDDIQLPYVIAPGVEFDRATTEEINRIKPLLSDVIGKNSMAGPFDFYESEGHFRADGSGHWDTTPLAESDWRYYVLRTPDNGAINSDILLLCLISEAWLDLATLHLHPFGHGWSPYTIIGLYTHGGFRTTEVVTASHLQEISELYRLKLNNSPTADAPEPYPELNRALHMLSALDQIPPSSSFHVLGLFAIIEMLITHNPKLEDRGDSITHQMRSKIPLLSKRFDRPLPYSKFFGQTSPEKIWNCLYAYRSAVAHGGQPDFSRTHQLLKDEKSANTFLRITTQALIRHAMREPELYRDLKQC
jgi:hypothetical protein